MVLSSRAMFDGRLSGVHGLTNFSPWQLVAWDEHLKIGQPQIDAQHEEIFALAQQSSDVCYKRCKLAELQGVTDELHEALAAHFAYEEGLLAGIGYAEFAEHRAEHQVVLGEMQLIRARVDEMDRGAADAGAGFLFLNYVLSTTVGHILLSDMDYGVFARQAARQDRPFEAIA